MEDGEANMGTGRISQENFSLHFPIRIPGSILKCLLGVLKGTIVEACGWTKEIRPKKINYLI